MSNFLPQALFVVPRCSAQCQPKSLAFSAAVSRRPSAAGSVVSRVSTQTCGLNFAEKDKKRSFVVRAETDSEAQAVVVEILNKKAIEASDNERPIPDLRTGDVVEIKLKTGKDCLYTKIFTEYQRHKSNEAPESDEDAVLLFARQASKALHG